MNTFKAGQQFTTKIENSEITNVSERSWKMYNGAWGWVVTLTFKTIEGTPSTYNAYDYEIRRNLNNGTWTRIA